MLRYEAGSDHAELQPFRVAGRRLEVKLQLAVGRPRRRLVDRNEQPLVASQRVHVTQCLYFVSMLL